MSSPRRPLPVSRDFAPSRVFLRRRALLVAGSGSPRVLRRSSSLRRCPWGAGFGSVFLGWGRFPRCFWSRVQLGWR